MGIKEVHSAQKHTTKGSFDDPPDALSAIRLLENAFDAIVAEQASIRILVVEQVEAGNAAPQISLMRPLRREPRQFSSPRS